MNEKIRITSELVLNQSKFDAQIKKIPDQIKNAVKKGGDSVSGFFKKSGSGGGSSGSQSSFVKRNEDRLSQARKDAYSGVSVADNVSTRGSIYEMARGDAEAVRDIYGIGKSGWAKMKGKSASVSGGGGGQDGGGGGSNHSGSHEGSFFDGMSKKTITNATFNVANGNFKGIGGSGQFGSGVSTGIGGHGAPLGGGDGPKGPEAGGGASKVGGALGMAGGFMLAAMGFVLKLASDVAQAAKQSYSKQSGTRGATGITVRGGEDIFADAEVAQANVALGKTTGKDIFKKGNLISKDVMAFARGNNESLSAMVTELSGIKKNTDPKGDPTKLSSTLAMVRGMANSAGFTGMKEVDFMKRVSSFASNRAENQGAFLNLKDYGQFTGGLNASEMTSGRRQNLSEKMQESAFAGPFSGDPIGQMAFAKAMEANGGDMDKALRDLEKNSGKYSSQSTSFLKDAMGGTAFGLMYKQAGIGSYTEGSSLTSNMKGFKDNNEMTNFGRDTVIGHTNALDAKYESSGMGLVEWEHKYQMKKADLATGVGEGVLNTMDAAESGMVKLAQASAGASEAILEGAQSLVEGMQSFFGKFGGGKGTSKLKSKK